jgi:ABC-2 type transport system permease protein
MSTQSLPAPDLSTRRAPGMGGLNVTVLGLEIRRLMRNRRTVIISIVFPVVFFLIFGLNKAYALEPDGRGNVAAFVMLSMALYGAVLATTYAGAMVSIERAAGWSRQLRLTPLSPVAYISIKMLTALVLGLCSVAAVFAAGLLTHKASMPGYLWIVSGLSVWIGSLVFAAFGLLMGYLLPTENVMQILGLGLAALSFLGGLFTPLNQLPHTVQEIAQFTPLYGLNQLVHAPMLGGSVHLAWVANAVIWLAIFAGGAMWRMRIDTARV